MSPVARPSAAQIIEELGLEPHPEEGGFFRETYRSAGEIPAEALSGEYSGTRSHSTAIYYLLTPESMSEMHLLPTDEVFHFYLGDPVEQLLLRPDGSSELVVLGPDLAAGQRVQHVVPGGVWQGARLAPGGAWALMGCTVAPGFDYADYTSGNRAELSRAYPEQVAAIEARTRG